MQPTKGKQTIRGTKHSAKLVDLISEPAGERNKQLGGNLLRKPQTRKKWLSL